MTTGKKKSSPTTRRISNPPGKALRPRRSKPPWYVYILECAGGRLYTGMTNDLARRLKAHTSGKGARFTRSFGVVRLRYTEQLSSRSKALRREAAIKRLTKKEKITLVEQHPPERQNYIPCDC